MNITDMDCNTMSYLLGAILIGVGLFAVVARQISLNSGTATGRHANRFRIRDYSERHLPGPTLEGWDAVLFGVFAIVVGVYLLLNPGLLLASFKVCTPL
jgi:uncharacterized membrane protein HdeD (DUF308 family)